MKNKIIFATGNMGKLAEIKEIMEGFDIISMKEAGAYVDVEENGTTFEENAMLKAEAIWKITGGIVLSDDSGLVVDAMGGEPGIYSARFMGRDTSYTEKNAEIIRRLEGLSQEERSARFVCAVAAVFPDGSKSVVSGTMEGYIGYEEKGPNGFGYDPIFIMPKYGITNGELAPEVKNKESHRAKALSKMRELLLERGIE